MSFLSYLFKPLAYVSLPVLLLHTASSNSPIARYYVRLGIYLSTIGLCSAWGALVSVGMSLIGRRFDINWVVARSFYALAGRALGIRFEVEGEEYISEKPAVLIGNHQSMLDILYLGRILPRHGSIMAKKELQWMPLLGQFMTLSGAIFVDRGNNAKAVKSLAIAGQTMKARRTSLWVFPEGTRSSKEKPDLLPFKKGAFHLAVQAGVPITPVVCENYWRMYHQGILGSGTLKLRVLPPVSTTGLSAADVPELVKTIREQMLVALHEISGTRPDGSGSQEKAAPAPPHSHTDLKPAVETPPVTTSGEPETAIPSTDETTPQSQKRDGSDTGSQTEEDEGMVLVDRPNP